jgi:hypothetical protein
MRRASLTTNIKLAWKHTAHSPSIWIEIWVKNWLVFVKTNFHRVIKNWLIKFEIKKNENWKILSDKSEKPNEKFEKWLIYHFSFKI